MSSLISVQDLSLTYSGGAVKAVDNVSFEVSAGEVLGVLGGNGAGKTSTMRVLAGLTPLTSGQVHVDSYSMDNSRDIEAARSILGYCPDTGGLIRQATVREHIAMVLALHKKTNLWPYALDLVEQFGLTYVLDRDTLGFSHGMSRRLSVLLAVLSASKVLILDEPFDGVDPIGVEATQAVIAQAKAAGLAVIVSTHLLALLAATADRMMVMSRGKVIDTAPVEHYRGEAGATRYAHLLKANQ